MESRLNSEADHYASGSHPVSARLPIAPEPTFFMNDFTFFSDAHGWIESDVKTYSSPCSLVKHLANSDTGGSIEWPPGYTISLVLLLHFLYSRNFSIFGSSPAVREIVTAAKRGNYALMKLSCIKSVSVWVYRNRGHASHFYALKDIERVTDNAVKTGDKDSKASDFPLFKHTAASLFLDDPVVWPRRAPTS
ncbi:hypothetical protein BDZ89DRAFT_1170023 [Hymenopellis radicata]|nr:hypothetical protein BDZ89DRAFT_1170023 [Hymenopellis radicata]